jgi:hypothetical protein
MEMTPTVQHEWHSHTGRPGKLTNDENGEILARARQQRTEHSVIDTCRTRTTMAEVTKNPTSARFDNVNNELIESFQFWSMVLFDDDVKIRISLRPVGEN